MKILHITPELAPWSKAGGLGDAAAGLVKAIAAEGHDVRIVTPLYGSVPDREKMTTLIEALKVGVSSDAAKATCRVLQLNVAPRCEAWFVEHAEYYGAREVYPAREDTAERAAYFGRAALDACLATGWIPDVIHCHDWTTGLVPVLLNTHFKKSALGRAASVLTIHNLQHQGLLSHRILAFLKLPESLFTADQLECFGGVNFLKGGILHATRVTTVSPSYAEEIQTGEYGFGLDDVVRRRSQDLDGILNGVDRDEWDPATDPHIAKKFSAKDVKGKADCKLDLQKQLNLKLDPTIPLIGVVSRLWDQKGLDLAIGVLPKFLRTGKIQFVLLGSGDAALENGFKKIAEDFPHAAAVRIGYDNGLSHRIEAGADFSKRSRRLSRHPGQRAARMGKHVVRFESWRCGHDAKHLFIEPFDHSRSPRMAKADDAGLAVWNWGVDADGAIPRWPVNLEGRGAAVINHATPHVSHCT